MLRRAGALNTDLVLSFPAPGSFDAGVTPKLGKKPLVGLLISGSVESVEATPVVLLTEAVVNSGIAWQTLQLPPPLTPLLTKTLRPLFPDW